MLFTLLHQVDSTECSLVSHFFGFDIFGRKEKFLGIHQQHAMLSGFMDHPLALFDSHGQRLFADNVFARPGTLDGHLCVQMVRSCDRNHLNIGFFQHLAIVSEHALDSILLGQMRGVSRTGRSYRDDLTIFRSKLESGGMNVALEARSDNSNFDFAVLCHELNSFVLAKV